MLYNPKWKNARPAVISLDGLIIWLETQDPATSYSYGSSVDCLLSRYLRAQGYKSVHCGCRSFSYRVLHFGFFPVYKTAEIPLEMNAVAVHIDRTYGAALKRARIYRG